MLVSSNTFAKTQFLLERGMDAAFLRRAVIADNISNIDTPHFKRSDVTFESQLKRALKSADHRPYPAKLTDKRHIPFYIPMDYRKVRAKIQIEHETNYRNDKNNVDIEKERIESTKNAMRYTGIVQMTDENFKRIRMILR